MGNRKRKWTEEEEAALRAGVARYGLGKWKAILKDSEFSDLLGSRSNVDLKDKWMNLELSIFKKSGRAAGQGNNKPTVANTVVESSPQVVVDNTEKLTVNTEPSPAATCSKKPLTKLHHAALKAITKLKEPHGSTLSSIASCIEERYSVPSHFRKLLDMYLNILVEKETLTLVDDRYRLSPSPISSVDSSNPVINGDDNLMEAETDYSDEKIWGPSVKEAAEAAAKAVQDAEVAREEAKAAAREAEFLEAEAEEADCFAEAVRRAFFRCPKYPRLVNSNLEFTLGLK